jgi:Protein of unknown function (DUF3038)
MMQLDSPIDQAVPLALVNLLDPELESSSCPRRARWQIDLLLLALEALDLAGSETMLAAVQHLELQALIPNRVALWRLRCTNPFRRFSQRQPLSLEAAKALVAIACFIARRQTVSLRQLLIISGQLQTQQLSPESSLQLGDYLDRFRRHFRSRMNLKRAGMAIYTDNERLNELGLRLLGQLLLCTGTVGMERLWYSLFDGEVA